MRRALYRLTVPLAALAAGLLAGFPVFILGLVVPEEAVLFCLAGFSAVFAALAASWTANLLAPDRTASRLLPIVGVAVAAALLFAGALLLVRFGLGADVRRLPLLLADHRGIALLCVVWNAAVASLAAWHLRRNDLSPARDFWISLGLAALALLVLIASLFIYCQIGRCGA